MAKIAGYNCSINIGARAAGTYVKGMGTWTMEGITADQMETSEFTDNWKTFDFGMKDGGTLTFNGLLDPDDTTGVQFLQHANLTNLDITSIRLYVDSTSYYMPCQTTSYWSPTTTNTADTRYSWVNIVSYSISADKSAMVTVDFTGKISGVMVIV